MNAQPDNLDIALDADDKELVPIPCAIGTKIPLVKWKIYQSQRPTRDLIRRWFSQPCNVAILTNDMVVFDCDDPELAERVLKECGDTPHKVQTPRGGQHLGYRARKGVAVGNSVKVKGLDLDIRTAGGIEVIPSSWTEHGEYAWLGSGLLPVAELPLAKVAWTRERVKKRVQSLVIDSSMDVMVRRARAWVACVEGAISGQGGHRRTFRVACKLTHPFPEGFGLSIEQAWAIIKEWNEQCEPPWSGRELTHKLEDAIKKKR